MKASMICSMLSCSEKPRRRRARSAVKLAGQPPTMETCRAYREQYGLEMTVLFDPDGVTQSGLNMLPNSDDMVLSQGDHIELNGSWGIETVENVLDSMFGH